MTTDPAPTDPAPTDPAHTVWDHLRTADRARRSTGMRRSLHPRRAESSAVDVSSNDYLSLAGDPRLVQAAVDATRSWGTGARASRLVAGSLTLHSELESALCELVGSSSALVFSSGYLANLGMVTALADADTLIVSDEHNHASLIDAARLARGRVAIYRHGDATHAEHLLATRTEPRALLLTDAVFSVTGYRAPLADLHRACRRHGAALAVDEAHAIGVIGPHGAGACAAAGIADADDVVISLTLSKSLASQGGAVLGAEVVREALINTARTMIFDTGLAPAPTAAALTAVEVLLADPGYPTAVAASAAALRTAAVAAGWPPPEAGGAVMSLLVGDAATAVAAQRVCADYGVLVGCFRPPSVPPGAACLRVTARAGLSAGDIDRVRVALTAARAEVARLTAAEAHTVPPQGVPA